MTFEFKAKFLAQCQASPRVAKRREAVLRLAKKVGADLAVVNEFLQENPEVRAINRNSHSAKAPYWVLARGTFERDTLYFRPKQFHTDDPDKTWVVLDPFRTTKELP